MVGPHRGTHIDWLTVVSPTLHDTVDGFLDDIRRREIVSDDFGIIWVLLIGVIRPFPNIAMNIKQSMTIGFQQ